MIKLYDLWDFREYYNLFRQKTADLRFYSEVKLFNSLEFTLFTN